MSVKNLLRVATLWAVLVTASHPAGAASLAFVPLTPLNGLGQGDIVSLEVVVDFSDVVDADGVPVGTVGGGFDIVFDPDLLGFAGLEYNVVGDPYFGRPPDILDGLLQSWGIGDYPGIIGPEIAGTVSFEVLASAPFSTDIELRTSLIGYSWIHAGDFVSYIDVDHGSVTLTGIPVPAPVWLMLPALGALFGVGRASTQTPHSAGR